MKLNIKTISQEEGGMRLDRCLRLWCPKLPQGLIEKTARKGLLKVNDVKVNPSQRLEVGQMVSFPESFLSLDLESSQKNPFSLTAPDRKWLKELILYQDEDILALNKPAGLAVQGGTKQHKSLDTMMAAYDTEGKVRLVHRLDQETSGILVMARSLQMARWLTKAFEERKIQKIYWAIVCGVPDESEGMITLPLIKRPGDEKVRVDLKEGLGATTSYRTLDTVGEELAWLELIPKTGRTHQLRVHCAEGLETPILGDGKYGGKRAFPLGRMPLHLHARTLVFSLPEGKLMTIEAPLPADLQNSFQELGFKVASH